MNFIIVGYGKFGQLAADCISRSFAHPRLIVVEREEVEPAAVSAAVVEIIRGDGVSFLVGSDELQPEDLIVPMVPFNLAASYAIATRSNLRKILLPDEIAEQAPNPVRIDEANLCCSRADFICPEDCPEGEVCTMTGEPREPLYEALHRIETAGYAMHVLRSFQLQPGIGGYTLGDLRALASRIQRGKHIIATSCKCHAILTAVEAE